MIDLYEITMKKISPNPHSIYQLTIGFEGLSREQAMIRSDEILLRLGLESKMNYIIRGYREEKL